MAISYPTNELRPLCFSTALGLDRQDAVGADRDDALHPGILRMIRDVVGAAHAAGRPVTVCGEMAADPDGALALAALQVDALSVPVGQLDSVRHSLAARPTEALAELGRELADLRRADQARALLRQWSGARRACRVPPKG